MFALLLLLLLSHCCCCCSYNCCCCCCNCLLLQCIPSPVFTMAAVVILYAKCGKALNNNNNINNNISSSNNNEFASHRLHLCNMLHATILIYHSFVFLTLQQHIPISFFDLVFNIFIYPTLTANYLRPFGPPKTLTLPLGAGCCCLCRCRCLCRLSQQNCNIGDVCCHSFALFKAACGRMLPPPIAPLAPPPPSAHLKIFLLVKAKAKGERKQTQFEN